MTGDAVLAAEALDCSSSRGAAADDLLTAARPGRERPADGGHDGRRTGTAAMTDRMRYGWQALPRPSVLGGCAAAGLLGAAGWRALDEPQGALMVLRGAAVLLACAVAFAVDDPSGDVLAASPTPLRRRVGLRILLAVAVAAAVWCGLLLLGRAAGGEPPAAALTLEALTLTVMGLAVALGVQRWRGVDCPGILAAPAVAGAVLAAFALPEKWALLPLGPGLPGWQEAHERWAALLAVAGVTALLATRDRAARRVSDHR